MTVTTVETMVKKMGVIKWHKDVIEHVIDIDTFWLLVVVVFMLCMIYLGAKCSLDYV